MIIAFSKAQNVTNSKHAQFIITLVHARTNEHNKVLLIP